MAIRGLLGGAGLPPDPVVLHDLALDQFGQRLARACGDRSPAPLLRLPLRDAAAIRARQDVFRDLDEPAVRAVVGRFTAAMRRTRRGLAVHARSPTGPANDRRFLDLALAHLADVRALAADLAAARPASAALAGVAEDLAAHVAAGPFGDAEARAAGLAERLGRFRYDLLIRDDTVTVAPSTEAADHARRVRTLLAPLLPPEQEAPGEPLDDGLDPLETAVLEQVVQLDPALFAQLAAFAATGLVDPELERLDHELVCCLGYLAVLAPLRAAGLPVCLPELGGTDLLARDVYDVALAAALVERGERPVVNDVTLTDAERVLVVSGPNQGGKSTLARTFGQLHLLAALGCPVPGSAVRCVLPDRVLTHFERAESIGTRDGKLAEELQRLEALLAATTADSVLVLNEIFSSTTLADARELSAAVLDRIVQIGARCLWVSFVDELAERHPAAVSMVATVTGDDATRTYRVVRAPADGRAYAHTLAQRHGVSAEQLQARVRR